MASASLTDKLQARFGGRVTLDESARDMPCLHVAPDRLAEICRCLKEEPDLRFDFLCDICGVDFYPTEPRFEIVYHLFSLPHRWRLRLKCRLAGPWADPPHAPSVTAVWATANWHERETYDMYGVRFDGHPDLRRIYMWEGYDGYPMRKDYPLRGYKDHYNPFGAERPGARSKRLLGTPP